MGCEACSAWGVRYDQHVKYTRFCFNYVLFLLKIFHLLLNIIVTKLDALILLHFFKRFVNFKQKFSFKSIVIINIQLVNIHVGICILTISNSVKILYWITTLLKFPLYVQSMLYIKFLAATSFNFICWYLLLNKDFLNIFLKPL